MGSAPDQGCPPGAYGTRRLTPRARRLRSNPSRPSCRWPDEVPKRPKALADARRSAFGPFGPPSEGDLARRDGPARWLQRGVLRAVGDAWVRVTTDAEVFDDHAESHEFLSPGGPLFEALAAPTPEGTSESGMAAGHCWLVEAGGDGATCEMLVLTTDGARRVHSLGDLLALLDRLPDREGFDGPRHPEGSSVRRLA